jgi:CRP/FNR family transcriptional regulator, cyclic AMP receptor protein
VTYQREERIKVSTDTMSSAPTHFTAGVGERHEKRRSPTMCRRQDTTVTAKTLAGLKIFRNVPHDTVQTLSRHCEWCWFDTHQAIVQHEDDNRDLFFVVQGKVRESYYSFTGREVILRILPTGEMFGELSAINGKPQSSTVSAMTKTLIASLPAPIFWDLLYKHELFAMMVLRRLAELVGLMSDRVIELSTIPVRNRIHTELLRLSRTSAIHPNTAIISPIPTHAEIASCINTHRETVTRELSNLARAGLIEKQAGKLVIRNVASLAQMVSEVGGKVSDTNGG